jgi:arylsulfatase A-like enzyme
MNGWCIISSFRWLMAIAIHFAAVAPATAQDKPSSFVKRPNIVFLLADDMRWDAMGCAGNPIIKTPNLDALASQGTRFKNAFVTTSICAASRASILTGLYERTHRYTFNTKPITPEHIGISYPVQLRKAGYRTGFVGKFGVGVPPGAA